jgi:hypothetical protein
MNVTRIFPLWGLHWIQTATLVSATIFITRETGVILKKLVAADEIRDQKTDMAIGVLGYDWILRRRVSVPYAREMWNRRRH